MTSKKNSLDQIAADIKDNNVCPDLAKTATNLVFGEGNPDAEVVFIGEAPGKQEDLSGRPFVGAAGRFLGEMLDSIGLKREDVYITSILKYRPPNNRDPKPKEKEAFMPYLLAQLEVIAPKLIVTLGKHGTNCFLPDLQIGKAHGKPQTWQGKTILPLYHPAAALYNNGMRQTIVDDFARIPAILKQIKRSTLN